VGIRYTPLVREDQTQSCPFASRAVRPAGDECHAQPRFWKEGGMHLPFASTLASYAVTAADARGGFATRDYDGQFASVPRQTSRGASLVSTDRATVRRAGAIHDSDRSLPINGPHRPLRAATASGMLFQRSHSDGGLKHSSWDTSAFSGSVGHLHDGVRMSPIRPILAGRYQPSRGHEDVRCFVTRHPCDVTPGPGKYDADSRHTGTLTQTRQQAQLLRQSMRIASEARLKRTDAFSPARKASHATRLQPAHASAVDPFPGPGSYPLSEWSDFRPRARMITDARVCVPSMVRPLTIYRTKEDTSVRGSTSSFRSSMRS
jgi:hypothetical protein